MKKVLLISLTIIIGIIALSFVFFGSSIVSYLFPKNVPGARTVYSGYVNIDPVKLDDIIRKLETEGCQEIDHERSENFNNDGKVHNPCLYVRSINEFDRQDSVSVLPQGRGFGPVSFTITETKLWDIADIPGQPDKQQFLQWITHHVDSIHNIVTIQPESLRITRTLYPQTGRY